MKSPHAAGDLSVRLSIAPERLATAVQALFPPSCSVAAQRRSTGVDGLTAQEALAVRKAVPERQGEFAAGRIAARRALAKLGVVDAEIPVGADRSPQWPSGTIGSISHAGDIAVAVVGTTLAMEGIGIDLEIDAAVHSELWPLLLLHTEQQWIESHPVEEQRHLATTLFSAKEAFYKFQYPLTGRWLDFTDVEVRIPTVDTFIVNVLRPAIPFLGAEFRGRLTHIEGLTVTAIHRAR